MKKYIFLIFILVIIIILTFISCKPVSLQTDLEKIKTLENQVNVKDEEIKNLNAELAKTRKDLESANKLIEEFLRNTTAETTVEEATEETITSDEGLESNLMDIIRDYIEESLEGTLTKFDVGDETFDKIFDKIYISYNSKWASEDTIKREMFDVISLFAGSDVSIIFGIDLTATGSHSGDSYTSYNSIETMNKLNTYKMDYSEWLEETFK